MIQLNAVIKCTNEVCMGMAIFSFTLLHYLYLPVYLVVQNIYIYTKCISWQQQTVTRTADHPFNDNQKVEHLVFLDILLHRLMPHPHRK